MLTLDPVRLGIRPGERVLDVGCGEGRHARESLRRDAALVVAVDVDREALATTKTNLWLTRSEHPGCGGSWTVCADANRLPFPDGFFDRVVCAETLEHVPTDRLVMAELVRVLRPGGRLGVSVPREFPETVCWMLSREYHEAEGGHVRIYRERELVPALEGTGLRLVDRHYAHALHSPYWWLRCALGAPEEGALLPRWYHRMLVWDIEHHPSPLGHLERMLDPILGKSLVLYFDKPEATRAFRETDPSIPGRTAAGVS